MPDKLNPSSIKEAKKGTRKFLTKIVDKWLRLGRETGSTES